MRDLIQHLADGTATIETFEALFKAYGNPYAMRPMALHMAYTMAMRADDPIVEIGSGLSSIVLGVAGRRTGKSVLSIESDKGIAEKLQAYLDSFDLYNVGVAVCSIDPETGLHDMPGLPPKIGVIVHDAPNTREGRKAGLDLIETVGKAAFVLIDDSSFIHEHANIDALAKNLGHALRYVQGEPEFAVLAPRTTIST